MDDHDKRKPKARESLGSTIFILCFGIGLLAFLIAIDRPHWFQLRPMSGVAKALSLAGEVQTADARRASATSR